MVTELPDGGLKCSCGATAKPKDRGRFKKRHPSACSAAAKERKIREEFSVALAQDVRSVVNSVTEVPDLLDQIDAAGSCLTKWEKEFIESVQDQYDRRGDLSERQIQVLRNISKKLPTKHQLDALINPARKPSS